MEQTPDDERSGTIMNPQKTAPQVVLTDEQLRMVELAQQGFHCSEVLLFMGLDAQGKVNPDLIKAVSSLAGGVGSSGDICGALTGGACLLGLYAGRGSAEEEEDYRLPIMISELMDWFAKEHQERYGGIHCRDIIEEDPRNMPSRCPRIVGRVYRKVKSIIEENGFDWKAGSPLRQQSAEGKAACHKACPVAAGQ
jgi:C_GCAxxG_C_C family probable redox protein